MLKRFAISGLLISIANFSHAGLVYNNDITGADMAGIEVTVDFVGGGSETAVWSTISTNLGTSGNLVADHEGFVGGASGAGWSLTQQGFSLGNLDGLGNVFGLWNFQDSTNTVSSIKINTGDTGIVFDTKSLNDLSEDTNGSGQGRAFLTETPGITATYSEPVFQELYNSLTLDLATAGTAFSFLADTDFLEESTGPAEVVLVQDEVVKVANKDKVNETVESKKPEAENTKTAVEQAITNSGSTDPVVKKAAAKQAIDDAATSGNKVAKAIQQNDEIIEAIAEDPTILIEATNTKIDALPPVIENPTTPEEIAQNTRNEKIIEILEEIVEQEIKDEWVVEGNGDIDVEIERKSGDISIGLAVTDETKVDEPLVFSSLIDTPDQAFTIDFNLIFETLTGSLEVSLENSLNQIFSMTYYAVDYQTLTSVSMLVDDSDFFNLTDATLTYSLFPGSPSSAFLSDINVNFLQDNRPDESVPAPTALSLLLLALGGLFIRRKQA